MSQKVEKNQIFYEKDWKMEGILRFTMCQFRKRMVNAGIDWLKLR